MLQRQPMKTSALVRSIIVGGALAAAGALAAFAILTTSYTPRQLALAAALKEGYNQSAMTSSDPRGTEAPDASAAEIDAGFMWARSYRPLSAASCPTISEAFRKGCADYIRDTARTDRGAVGVEPR